MTDLTREQIEALWAGAAPHKYGNYLHIANLARQLLATMTALAEVQAAQALVVEKAAAICNERGVREEKDFGLVRSAQNYYRARDAIRSLADPTGVKLLAEMRSERDLLRADRDSAARMWQASEQEREAAVERAREASQMLAIETNHAAQAEAERDRLRADYAGQVQDLIAQQTEITDLRAQLAEAQKREASLKSALSRLLRRDEINTCQHEDTYRGGAIWEICHACGSKWADDVGGKPDWTDPPEWVAARAALSAAPTTIEPSSTSETHAQAEDRICSCGAGHGSLEGHLDWCDWISYLALPTAPIKEESHG